MAPERIFPNDIDILVFANESQDIIDTEIQRNVQLGTLSSSYYDAPTEQTFRENGLHIFATTYDRFKDELDNNVSEALSVINDGVLISGQLPFKLKSSIKAKIYRNDIVVS